MLQVRGDDKALVDELNKAYMGFDETDATSPLGVYLSMASSPNTYWGNVYCSKMNNPNGNTTCFNGFADCKMAASLVNHKMMLSSTTGKINVGLSRATGYIFNRTLVEKKLAKCAWIWDGATNNRYNNGCGDGAPGNDCTDKTTAFYDICPSTGGTCKGDDLEITRTFCKGVPGGTVDPPRSHDGRVQCMFPGPGIDYHGQDGFTPSTAEYLRLMANTRVKYNNGKDDQGPNIEKWNEVDLDERLLDKDSIVAFFYVKSRAPIAVNNAQDMQSEYSDDSGITVPLIGLDDGIVIAGSNGPFFARGDHTETVVV